jgi:hypothetical protein
MSCAPLSTIVTVAVLLLPVPVLTGQEVIAWGEPNSGLQLGASFVDVSAERGLRVSLRNTSAEEKNVYIGTESRNSYIPAFHFVAVDSQGRMFHLAELSSFIPEGGLTLPKIIQISGASQQDWFYPLKNIICFDCKGVKTFADFAKEHAALQIRFGTDAQSVKSVTEGPGGFAKALWTGKLASGELKP